MTIDAALAALTAGLKRDEDLARAAIGGTEASRWVATVDEVYAVTGALTGPHRCDQHAPGVPNGCDDDPVATVGDVRDDAATIEARAAHIAAQGPRTTLLRVKAIRELMTGYERERAALATLPDNELGRIVAARLTGLESAIEALASIYPEGDS
jgi:hypothetical protein